MATPSLISPRDIKVAANLCHHTQCVSADTRNSEVFAIFNTDIELQSLPVLDEERTIIGLINRERFMGRMTLGFHWEVFSKKRCTKMMDHDPLVVEADTPIREVANRLAGNDGTRALSESFIVAAAGVFLGTGYTSDVLLTLLEHEQEASSALSQHRDGLARMVEERTRDLTMAMQAAEQANLAKSEFLTNMSHELRTPLHAVLAFANFGKEKYENSPREKLGQYFTRIHESAERLTGLVNDLLDLSKLDAGKMVLNLTSVDLCQLCDRVLAEFAALAEQRHIELRHDNDIELALAYCDIERIHQVLANVLGNAIKFSAEGSTIIVSLSTYYPAGTDTRATPTGYRIRIVDEGQGIPEDELETIFNRFSQSSKTRTGAGGTGLGLPISREIMRLHQGFISASNNADGGACFSIEFPAQ